VVLRINNLILIKSPAKGAAVPSAKLTATVAGTSGI